MLGRTETCRPACTAGEGSNLFAERRDSVAGSRPIGFARIVGKPSDVVRVTLELQSPQSATGRDSLALVVNGVTIERLSVRDMQAGRLLQPFAQADTALIAVVLETTATRRASAYRLLVLTDASLIASALGPAADPHTRSAVALSVGGTSCDLTTRQGTCGTTGWTILPFEPGNPLGSFQSAQGTGASAEITISFTAPITSITVTAYDPTYVGNRMSATGPAGTQSVAFAGSGTPGIQVPSTKTLTGNFTSVTLTPAVGDYVAYSGSFTVGTQAVQVVCTPATPIRGEEVDCKTTMATPVPFVIIRRTARGDQYSVEDPTRIVYAAGASDSWHGTAVTSARVVVEVELQSGASPTRLKSAEPAGYTVQARSWNPWQLTTLRQRLVQLIPPMTEYLVAKSTLGVFEPDAPNVLETDVGRAESGPNKGFAFLRNPVDITSYVVGIYPGLVPPQASTPAGAAAWYTDQNGIGSGNCLASNVGTLLANVDRHEGTTQAPNSHFGVANTQFASLRPDRLFERIVTQGSDAQLYALVERTFSDFIVKGTYKAAQKAFDVQDTPNVNAIGCTLDLNPTDQ